MVSLSHILLGDSFRYRLTSDTPATPLSGGEPPSQRVACERSESIHLCNAKVPLAILQGPFLSSLLGFFILLLNPKSLVRWQTKFSNLNLVRR